jgi:hypothetical protein
MIVYLKKGCKHRRLSLLLHKGQTTLEKILNGMEAQGSNTTPIMYGILLIVWLNVVVGWVSVMNAVVVALGFASFSS